MANLDQYIGAFDTDTAADTYLSDRSYDSSDGLIYRNTTYGVLKIYDGQQSAWIPMGSSKMLLTPEGGFAVLLTNETGANSVKGELVKPDTAADDAFILTAGDDQEIIGVVYESGVADGSECYVVIGGIAEVLLKDTTASTHGNWVKTSDTAGRADASNAAPPGGGVVQLDEHMQEIGHCLESNAGGSDQLIRILMHFN